MKTKILISTVSLLLGVILFAQWFAIHDRYLPNENQLSTDQDVKRFLEQSSDEKGHHSIEQYKTSRVGLFVQSLKFTSANDVEISGYVWQKISKKSRATIAPGVVFVDAIGGVTLDKRYTQKYDTYDLHGWYFEANLRQPFDYSDYPIDHKTIWVKVRPAGLNQTGVFLPDLSSYDSTGVNDTFGLSPDMVLLGWDIDETFYDYLYTEFDNNFGHEELSHHFKLPVLAFNIVLNRKFLNAFMVNLTLLFVTMFLLYILVVMITSNNQLKEEFDISVGGAIASCSGIFFAILLAHIHLREQFTSSGFIYLEFFYLLNYFFILMVALIVYLFYSDHSVKRSILLRDDAHFLKVAFWPSYFVIANVYTWFHFS